MQNINIQELVNEITQPDAVCLINDEVPETSEKRYLHLIYGLANVVKQCFQKEMYNPYLHIKDGNGDFLYNDRLYIEESKIYTFALKNTSECEIHLIKKEDSLGFYYHAITQQSLTNDNRFYLEEIDFNDGVFGEKMYDEAADSIIKMIKKRENIRNNIQLITSTVVHNYKPKTKQWSIEHWNRKKR